MNLTEIERKTFIILLFAVVFNAFVDSIGRVQDIIAKKALDGLDWQITIIVMIWPVANFFSIWWGKILERTENKSRYFLIVGIFGRLILVFALWITNVNQFILLLAIVHSFSALFIPLQNSLLQANFRPENRGRLFGYTRSLTTIVIVLLTFFAGRMLDRNENFYKYMLFVFGIMSFIGAFLFSRVKFNKRRMKYVDKPLDFKEIFISPITRTFEVLKKNRAFALFELNFFIYGTGFMIVLPVIPKYMVETLDMSYTSTFVAKGVFSQIGVLFLSPFAGKIFDKNNPCIFSGMAFGMLAFYPITFLLSSFIANRIFAIGLVFLAYLLFGIAMSGISISWFMGSIFFAGEEDASMYQSVHVTLTGLRGLLIPPIGYAVMKLVSIQMVFGIAAFAFLLAAYLSYRTSCELG